MDLGREVEFSFYLMERVVSLPRLQFKDKTRNYYYIVTTLAFFAAPSIVRQLANMLMGNSESHRFLFSVLLMFSDSVREV